MFLGFITRKKDVPPDAAGKEVDSKAQLSALDEMKGKRREALDKVAGYKARIEDLTERKKNLAAEKADREVALEEAKKAREAAIQGAVVGTHSRHQVDEARRRVDEEVRKLEDVAEIQSATTEALEGARKALPEIDRRVREIEGDAMRELFTKSIEPELEALRPAIIRSYAIYQAIPKPVGLDYTNFLLQYFTPFAHHNGLDNEELRRIESEVKAEIFGQ